MQLTGRTMTDHIVVFEGNERLIGRTISVQIEEATAFTLFGTVVTGERIGVDMLEVVEPPAIATRRIGLPRALRFVSRRCLRNRICTLSPARMTEIKAAISSAGPKMTLASLHPASVCNSNLHGLPWNPPTRFAPC